jgi:hypothetical protein
VAASVVGGAALPLVRVGIGWPIGAVALTGVVAAVRVPACRARTRAESMGNGVGTGVRLFRVAMGLAALVLVAVAAVRAAGWLVTIGLAAAGVLASYALLGGEGWGALVRAGLALPRAALGALRRIAPDRTIRRPDRTALRAAAGVAVGLGLLVVFGALFRAADPVFADLVRRWTAGLSAAEVARATIALVLAGLAATGVASLASSPAGGAPRPGPAPRPPTRLDWVEWAAPLFMLDALFAIFVYVQLTVLFAGHQYVLGPGGPTYAEYARAGFAELLTVTILTLGVVAALARFAGRATRSRRVLLRLLGGVLGGLTLVIVASALRRMAVYAEAYGFTRPRLLADAVEVLLGLVFVLILLAGVRLRATWLPRAVLGAGAAVLLGLAALNPDAYIARTVIDRYHKDGHLDAAYLATLSADAVAEIDKLPEPVRTCILAGLAADLDRREPWYGWNAGRQAAREILRGRPRVCPS